MPLASTMPPGLESFAIEYWSPSFGEWPLYPYCFEEASRKTGVSFSETRCRFMIACLIVEGELLYRCDGSESLVEAGSLVSIPQGSSYSFETTGRCGYRKLVLEIKGSLLDGLSERLGLSSFLFLKPAAPQAFEGRMRELGRLLAEGGSPLASLGRVYEFLSLLSLEARCETPEERLLSVAKARLESFGGASSGGIAELARSFGVCHSKLDRLFRKALGKTPQEFRLDRRLEDAKYYLERTSLSMKEISMRLGYASQLYFSNDFRKRCGVSPKLYRKRHGELPG